MSENGNKLLSENFIVFIIILAMKGSGMIRTRLILLIAWSIISIGSLVSVRGAELQQITLLLDWFPNADQVPIYVAKETGIFAKYGLEIELVPPTDPADPIKLVAAGKFSLAVSYQPSVTIARASDLPIKSIGILVDHPLNTISFLKKSEIEVPSDLKGKKLDILLHHWT